MSILRTCILSAALLMLAGLASAAPEASVPTIPLNADTGQVKVPEPNTMLFAGIGGLIILVFAIRRK